MIIQQRHAKIKLINIRSIYFDNQKICRKKYLNHLDSTDMRKELK